MGGQFFSQLITFLATNLNYILIGIGVLVLLFFVTLAFPKKRRRKPLVFENAGNLDEVRKQFEDAVLGLETLIAGYRKQVEAYDQAIFDKKDNLQALDQQRLLLEEHVAKFNEAPAELKNAVMQNSLRALGYPPKRSFKFFWGMMTAFLLVAMGFVAYRYQAEIMALFGE